MTAAFLIYISRIGAMPPLADCSTNLLTHNMKPKLLSTSMRKKLMTDIGIIILRFH
jgi:hypothetical protein